VSQPDALVYGLIVSCVALPLPMILAVMMKRKPIEGDSVLSKSSGVVFGIVALFGCVALYQGLRIPGASGELPKFASFLFNRYLFFGGALVCSMILGISCWLVAGKADSIKRLTGLDWPGYLAGLLATQAIVFFQQCNMQGVFQ